jgi:hypothetical protein
VGLEYRVEDGGFVVSALDSLHLTLNLFIAVV